MIFEIAGKVGAIGEPVTGIRLKYCAHRQASSCQRAGPSAEREFCAQRGGVVAGVTKLAFGGAKAKIIPKRTSRSAS